MTHHKTKNNKVYTSQTQKIEDKERKTLPLFIGTLICESALTCLLMVTSQPCMRVHMISTTLKHCVVRSILLVMHMTLNKVK